MLLNRIDHWVGKTLFVPPVIKFCQWTRQSQFAVSRLFWFVAALDGFYRAETVSGSVIFGGLSLYMMVTASIRADTPTLSFAIFRMLTLVFLAFDVVAGVMGEGWLGVEFWVLVLFAEYAATIRTIPPRETRRDAKSAKVEQA